MGKPELDAKFWVNFVIALCALMLGVWNIYWNDLRQKDEVRLAPGVGPSVRFRDNRVQIDTKHSITLINAGNRFAGVTNVGLALKRSAAEQRPDCRDDAVAIAYPVGPFVLQKSEIATKELSLGSEEWLPIDVPGTPQDAPEIRVLVCMWFVLVTPDSDMEHVEVPLGAATLQRSGGLQLLSSEGIRPYGKPILLLKR